MKRAALDEITALELVALALFFIGGAIIGLAIGIVYIGVNLVVVMGGKWDWIWS